MSVIYEVDSWSIFRWIILFFSIGFVFFWVTGSRKLNDIEERIVRIEMFDNYYSYPGGFLLLQLRNIICLIVLIIIFNLV